MNPLPKKPWNRRWWARVLALVAILCVVGLGWKLYQEHQADKELAAELEHLNQTDPNWQMEDWDKRRPTLPDGQNLSVAALNLKSKIMPIRFVEQVEETDADPVHLLRQDEVDDLKRLLKDCASLPLEIERLLSIKSGGFPLPDMKDARFRVLSISYPQQRLRTVAQMLKYYSQLSLQAEQPAPAMQSVEAMLQLGRSCANDPGIVSQFVSLAMYNHAVAALERCLAMSQPTAASLEKLQARLLAEVETDLFRAAVVGERAILDRYLREVAEGRYSSAELVKMFRSNNGNRNSRSFNISELFSKTKEMFGMSPYGYLPAERTSVLRFFRTIIQRLDQQPAPNILEIEKLVNSQLGHSCTVDKFGVPLSRLYQAELKRRMQLQMAAALIAAERYRLATGKLPVSWNDIVPSYLPAIPADPYDTQLLRWKNTPTGFIVYSVWTNGMDDHGNIRQAGSGGIGKEISINPKGSGVNGRDIGLEFFGPIYRRQPALALRPRENALDDKEAFFAAARGGDNARIKILLDSGFDVNTRTEYGATALCYAAENGHLEIMRLLIDKKIDIHAKDTFYSADALTWAQMKDQDEAVALLLKAGAKGESSVLAAGISANKPKLVAAAIATGRIKQETLDSSLSSLDPKKNEIAKLLADAGAKAKPKETKPDEKKTEASKTAPAKDDTPQPTAAVVEPTEKPKEAKPWLGFRGDNNSGVVDGQFPPTAWDATTGKNLAWKTPIPGLGLSCPVVWGNRLFITTAINEASPKPSLRIGQYGDVDSVKENTPHTWKTYCLDTDTGKILWEQTAYIGIPKVKRHMKSSHANATVATDGNVVVVNFGSEGLYCYSMEGELHWRKELGKLGSSWFFNPDYEWGFGSSPIIYRGNAIIQCDIGKQSFLAAYSLINGEQMWVSSRDEIPSWTSPTLVPIENGKMELVTVASKYARGYNPQTGEELWKLGKFSEIAVPTPFYANGLVYLTTGYRPIQPIYAIKPGGKGDLTLPKDKESSDSIVWSKQRGGPYLPTPLVYGDYLYVCSNSGVLSCYEAKTGKTIYQKRLGGKNGYTASLVAADGRLYCTDEEGLVRVVKTGPDFQILALNKLGEECLSHPAISNGRIFFRGREHVQAFEVKK